MFLTAARKRAQTVALYLFLDFHPLGHAQVVAQLYYYNKTSFTTYWTTDPGSYKASYCSTGRAIDSMCPTIQTNTSIFVSLYKQFHKNHQGRELIVEHNVMDGADALPNGCPAFLRP